MQFLFRSPSMPPADKALPGRPDPIMQPKNHTILGTPIGGPYPDGFQIAEFALGCFWGEEKTFWEQPGVWTTAVGYQGGFTPNPTYRESVTGKTGHAETVRVVFDPSKTSYEQLLKVFWENHDPTQGMRQGNDMGTEYRSAIFVHDDEQRRLAETCSRSSSRPRATARSRRRSSVRRRHRSTSPRTTTSSTSTRTRAATARTTRPV
jgi:peptide-methionine (S)-S-oxide reductase